MKRYWFPLVHPAWTTRGPRDSSPRVGIPGHVQSSDAGTSLGALRCFARGRAEGMSAQRSGGCQKASLPPVLPVHGLRAIGSPTARSGATQREKTAAGTARFTISVCQGTNSFPAVLAPRRSDSVRRQSSASSCGHHARKFGVGGIASGAHNRKHLRAKPYTALPAGARSTGTSRFEFPEPGSSGPGFPNATTVAAWSSCDVCSGHSGANATTLGRSKPATGINRGTMLAAHPRSPIDATDARRPGFGLRAESPHGTMHTAAVPLPWSASAAHFAAMRRCCCCCCCCHVSPAGGLPKLQASSRLSLWAREMWRAPRRSLVGSVRYIQVSQICLFEVRLATDRQSRLNFCQICYRFTKYGRLRTEIFVKIRSFPNVQHKHKAVPIIS